MICFGKCSVYTLEEHRFCHCWNVHLCLSLLCLWCSSPLFLYWSSVWIFYPLFENGVLKQNRLTLFLWLVCVLLLCSCLVTSCWYPCICQKIKTKNPSYLSIFTNMALYKKIPSPISVPRHSGGPLAPFLLIVFSGFVYINS